MNSDAVEARHLDLLRLEHAAGAAFGCEALEDHPVVRIAMAPAALAVATLAIAVAATLAYLV